jgi:type IV secretory pathway VirB2 component (pilin)
VTTTATANARRAADSDALTALARWGLAARATNYLLIGVLAIALAAGKRSGETDQHGALDELVQHTGGTVLLWIIAIGLAGYALWRLNEAAFGVAGHGTGVGPRLQSLGRAVAYAVLAASAVSIATNSDSGSQSGKQQNWTARIMQHTGGRWLVAAVGVGLVIFGIVLVAWGLLRKFEQELDKARIPASFRPVVFGLGLVGTCARGVVFALVGVLVVIAAVDYDPKKSAGLDGALRTLRDTPAGPWLLGIVALGLVVFGLYGYCEAAWHKT